MKASKPRGSPSRQRKPKVPKLPPPPPPLMAAVPAIMTDPTNLRAVMNAHGAAVLTHLGHQMNTHLNSLTVFEGTAHTLAYQCTKVVQEIGKLQEVLQECQGAHTEVVMTAAMLETLIAEFAQHVYNSNALAIPTGKPAN